MSHYTDMTDPFPFSDAPGVHAFEQSVIDELMGEQAQTSPLAPPHLFEDRATQEMYETWLREGARS